MTSTLLATVAGLAVLAFAAPSNAATLDVVKSRELLVCGVNTGTRPHAPAPIEGFLRGASRKAMSGASRLSRPYL
jgi:hypothetical protein